MIEDDSVTNNLTVLGTLKTGFLRTNHLHYANGVPWPITTGYSNNNVYSYLSTYVGELNPCKVTSSFEGSGANLTDIPGSSIVGTVSHALVSSIANSVSGANVTGTVANATNATMSTFASTVITPAQPNITSTGVLNSISATGTINFTNASNVSLGVISNVRIKGGTNGQVLTATSTDGIVQWSTPTVGTLHDVVSNGNETTLSIHVSDIKLTPGKEPTNAIEGTLYYDATIRKLRIYNGTDWETITSM